LFPDFFRWQPHFDVLMGSPAASEGLDGGRDPGDICRDWESDEDGFRARRAPYLLYE
jgi:hypothetical protein